MLYFPIKGVILHPYLSTTATFFCPQGGRQCGKVQLYCHASPQQKHVILQAIRNVLHSHVAVTEQVRLKLIPYKDFIIVLVNPEAPYKPKTSLKLKMSQKVLPMLFPNKRPLIFYTAWLLREMYLISDTYWTITAKPTYLSCDQYC